MSVVQRAPLVLLALTLPLAACGPDLVGVGDDEAGETTDGGDIGDTGDTGTGVPCWQETRTRFPNLHSLWSDGERALVYGEGAFVTREAGEWSVSADPEWHETLGFGTSQILADDPDAVWIAVGSAIYLWDGATLDSTFQSLPDARVGRSPSGAETYAIGDYFCTDCTRIWSWDGGAWNELDPVLLAGGRLIEVGEGELWIAGNDGVFAHRVGDSWTNEALADPVFSPSGLELGEDGTLWATGVGPGELLRLARRDPLGAWTEVDSPTLGYGPVDTVAAGDHLYYLTRPTPDSSELWIWDGVGQPEFVESYTDARALDGDADQAFLLVDSRIEALDLPANPGLDPTPAATVEYAYQAVTPAPGSAVALDAVFEASPEELRRWDGEAWTSLAPLPGADYVWFKPALWAESETVAWIVGDPELEGRDAAIWRWDGQALEEVDAGLPPDIALDFIWGSSSERIFAAGKTTKLVGGAQRAVVWAYDGSSWSELVGPDAGWLPPVGFGGSADRLWLLETEGTVHEYAAGEWSSLAPLSDETTAGSFADLGGGEMLLAYSYLEGWDFPDTVYDLVIWDGQSWIPASERWPSLPLLVQLFPDRAGGIWGWAFDDPVLRYFDGESWGGVETPSTDNHGYTTASPDGLFRHGDWTQRYHWSCPG